MSITPLPALDRTDVTFKEDVDLFFGSQLPTFSIQVESARVEIDLNTSVASNSATTATEQALIVQQALAISGAIAWTAGTYLIGNLRYSTLNQTVYRALTNHTGSTDPSLDPFNWAQTGNISSGGAAASSIFLHTNFGGF